MRFYKTETVNKEKINKISCDKCGVVCHRVHEHWEAPYMHAIELTPGYGSILDGMPIKLDICDDCFVKFILRLRHQPSELSDYNVSQLGDGEGC